MYRSVIDGKYAIVQLYIVDLLLVGNNHDKFNKQHGG